jgi:glycosyltransferase involved in cell wall biosynthesis
MPPLVSILTPAYNAASYLADTIRSVLAQTWKQVEIIVVNDGSRDETLAVARSFRDRRVKVIDQQNRGQSASENVAFRASQGEYVVHLDADDLISPNKVETQLRRLLDAEPGCVAFHPWARFHDHPENARLVPEPFWRDIKPLDFHIEMWERHSMVQGACYLIPRGLIETAPPWDERLSLANDFPYFPRVLLLAPLLLFCPDAVLCYRSGLSTALSGQKSPAAWMSAYRAVTSGTSFLLEHENSLRTRRACCRQLEEFAYSSYPLVPELRSKVWRRVGGLGGPHFQPQMGRRMRALSRLVGWKFAIRVGQWVTTLSNRPARTT